MGLAESIGYGWLSGGQKSRAVVTVYQNNAAISPDKLADGASVWLELSARGCCPGGRRIACFARQLTPGGSPG